MELREKIIEILQDCKDMDVGYSETDSFCIESFDEDRAATKIVELIESIRFNEAPHTRL